MTQAGLIGTSKASSNGSCNSNGSALTRREGVDIAAARRAAADFLTALGIEIDTEDLRETPARMARAYAELFDAQPLRLTTFPNDEGYDELVLARDIPFRTVCEHHLLPFSGVAHVGYLPGDRIVGLSKLTSTLLGTLRADPRSRAEFFALAGVPS